MTKIENAVLLKLIGMFRPHSKGDFLGFPASEVICGPDDRSAFGYETNFPKARLMEDYGFTEKEAEWLIRSVRANAKEEIG